MQTENSRAEIAYYDSVQESAVEWLWYPYIPYGKITLLQGDPGDGKSTFMLHLSAQLTVGGMLPDGRKIETCQTVIYQCSEDNSSDTIKPRLLAAGADCEKVAYIVERNEPLCFDDARIEEAIEKTNARLVIFDPLQSFIPPESDMTNAVRMRSMMRKLSVIAEKYKCAIVLIGHMTKARGGKKLYRGLGSIDLAAIARSVLMITRDEELPNIRYMVPVKTSLAYEGCAIRFLFDRELGFQILGPCDLELIPEAFPAEEAGTGKSQKAERLLRMVLSGTSLPSKKVLEQMNQIGVSERTARKVMKQIGVKAFRKGNSWYWKLEDRTGGEELQQGR